MSILSEFKDILYPKDFDFWRYDPSVSQSLKEYTSFEQIIFELLETQNITKKESPRNFMDQIEIGINRRKRLKIYREFLSVSRGMLYLSFGVITKHRQAQ